MENLSGSPNKYLPSKDAMISLSALIVAAVLLVVVPAYVGMGSLNHLVLAGAFIGFIALPFFFFTLLIARVKRPANWGFLYPAEIAMGVIALVFAGCVLGGKFSEWEIARAKAAVDRFVYALEKFRAEHGSYPDRLSGLPLGLGEDPPRLLSYHSSGQDFGFEIKDPRAMFGGVWTYDMESHRWEDRGD